MFLNKRCCNFSGYLAVHYLDSCSLSAGLSCVCLAALRSTRQRLRGGGIGTCVTLILVYWVVFVYYLQCLLGQKLAPVVELPPCAPPTHECVAYIHTPTIMGERCSPERPIASSVNYKLRTLCLVRFAFVS